MNLLLKSPASNSDIHSLVFRRFFADSQSGSWHSENRLRISPYVYVGWDFKVSVLWGKMWLDESLWDIQLWPGVVEAATMPKALLAPWSWAGTVHSCHSKWVRLCCGCVADLLLGSVCICRWVCAYNVEQVKSNWQLKEWGRGLSPRFESR